MGKTDAQPEGFYQLDLDFWLNDRTLIAKARRAGVKKLIDFADLAHELRHLVEWGIVKSGEARALLEELAGEGLIDSKILKTLF